METKKENLQMELGFLYKAIKKNKVIDVKANLSKLLTGQKLKLVKVY